jgi:molybdopterin/thiamine biosynthesis adenylyltransferase
MEKLIFQNYICLGEERDVYPNGNKDKFHVQPDDGMFVRHAHLLTPEKREILARSRVAIPGVGGVGAIAAERLARLGIGSIHIADGDTYNRSNLNRQLGSSTSNLGQKKVIEIEKLLTAINPECHVKPFEMIDSSNVSEFMERVDVLVLCSDETQSAHAMILKAQEMGKFVVSPRISGWMACCGLISPNGLSYLDYYSNFNLPLGAPTSFFTNASLGIPCAVAGAMAASLATRAILDDMGDAAVYPLVYEFDCWNLQINKVKRQKG